MLCSPTIQQLTKPEGPILIVEDDVDQWFIIRWALLRRFPSLEPIWAPDSDKALAYLETCLEDQEGLPHLILLDLYLPHRETGLTFLEIIKNHSLYRDIPVVMLSHSTYPDDIKDAYLLNCDFYIVKPGDYQKWIESMDYLETYWRIS